MKAPAIPRHLKATASKFYEVSDFKIGDKVWHRSWTLPMSNFEKQYPVVLDRRFRIVTDIKPSGDRVYIYTGSYSYSASELIKES